MCNNPLFNLEGHAEFFEWIDDQIKLEKEGVVTPLHYLWNNAKNLTSFVLRNNEDAICYSIIEAFEALSIENAVKHLQLRWPSPLSTQEYSQLLLIIPLRILVAMMHITKNPDECWDN